MPCNSIQVGDCIPGLNSKSHKLECTLKLTTPSMLTPTRGPKTPLHVKLMCTKLGSSWPLLHELSYMLEGTAHRTQGH